MSRRNSWHFLFYITSVLKIVICLIFEKTIVALLNKLKHCRLKLKIKQEPNKKAFLKLNKVLMKFNPG